MVVPTIKRLQSSTRNNHVRESPAKDKKKKKRKSVLSLNSVIIFVVDNHHYYRNGEIKLHRTLGCWYLGC